MAQTTEGRQLARRLARIAAQAGDGKGAREVVILEVGEVLVVADEFVVMSAPNDRQVKAIVEEIEKKVSEAGLGDPFRVEGRDERRWVLMDYGDVVVHVFLQDVRAYYELERLWSDVPRIVWTPELTPSP